MNINNNLGNFFLQIFDNYSLTFCFKKVKQFYKNVDELVVLFLSLKP